MTTFPLVTAMQRGLVATCILFSILPVLATALRILSRRIAHRTLNASDYCAIAATVLAIGLNVANICGVFLCGLGYAHQAAIVAQHGWAPIHVLVHLFIPWEFLWAVSLSFSKTSILLLYCKLFPGSYVVLAARLTIAVIVTWAVVSVVFGLLICRPSTSGSWATHWGDHCTDLVTYFFVTGLVNLATDVMVLILPLSHLYRLRLPKATKLSLIVVMSLGVVYVFFPLPSLQFSPLRHIPSNVVLLQTNSRSPSLCYDCYRTCIISINRLIYICDINTDDMTWSLGPAAIFSVLEPSMAVTLGCVPLMKPLLGMRRRRRQPPRVKVVAGHSLLQRTHRYDPDYAGQLKLRPDRVEHRAEISAHLGGRPSLCGGGGGGLGINAHDGGIAVPERSYDSSGVSSDWKGSTGGEKGENGAEITVNRQWAVTREARNVGEWTQILGG